MNKLITIHDTQSNGRINLHSPRKNSKIIRVQVSLDNYGFEVHVDKEELKEFVK